MTPTEIEKINREFAEKLMGFTKHGISSWLNPNDGEVWFFDEFDPYHRIDHAWLGLEKFPMWTVRKDKKLYQAMVRPWSSYTFYSEWVDTAPAAITLACLEAKKEKE